MFDQYQNIGDFNETINSKATVDHISMLQEKKADRVELNFFEMQLKDFQNKVKHLTVYQHELAQSLVPKKLS